MVELVEIMKKVSEKKLTYKIVDYPDSYPADEPNRRVPNIDKAKLDLKYLPRINLEDGLERFLSWSNLTYKGEN